MDAPAFRQPRYDWWVVFGLVITVVFCGAFWFGVGYGANVAWHAIWPNPKPDPPPAVIHPKPDPAGIVCVESSPPLPHIYTAITCTRA